MPITTQRTRTYGIPYSFCPNHTGIIEALARAKLSGREFRIVLLIMRQTDGYLRGEDQISPAFFAARTGIQKTNVSHALARLIAWGVIAVSPGNPPFYSVQPTDGWAAAALVKIDEPATTGSSKPTRPSSKMTSGLVENDEKSYVPIDNTKDNSLKMWDSILSEIRNQVTQSVYQTWLEGTTGRMSANTMIIDAPSALIAESLNSRFHSLIASTIRQVTGTEMPIQIRHRRKP